MKQILTSFFIVFLISSCSEVRFSQPQPLNEKELSDFPSQFVGTYLSADGDTLVVSSKCFVFAGDDRKKLCSDKVVLKQKGSLHIISSKEMLVGDDKMQRKGWEVLPFELVNDSLVIYFLNTANEDESVLTINKLEAILEVEKIMNDQEKTDYFYIDPTSAQFDKILDTDCFTVAEKFARIK